MQSVRWRTWDAHGPMTARWTASWAVQAVTEKLSDHLPQVGTNTGERALDRESGGQAL